MSTRALLPPTTLPSHQASSGTKGHRGLSGLSGLAEHAISPPEAPRDGGCLSSEDRHRPQGPRESQVRLPTATQSHCV